MGKKGEDFALCPNSQVALKVNYPVQEMMYACEIVSATSEKIVVESPKRFETNASRSSSSARRKGSRGESVEMPQRADAATLSCGVEIIRDLILANRRRAALHAPVLSFCLLTHFPEPPHDCAGMWP